MTFSIIYGYDYVDEIAYGEMANINAQEQVNVLHELSGGDFREAQQIIQYDEAIKHQIRREEAINDRPRDMRTFIYRYSEW
ncbi:MAG: hypothetical protein PHI13_13055 [Methylococcales bacterium]|nr:hypothetical protein [Methylococcales bacterium]